MNFLKKTLEFAYNFFDLTKLLSNVKNIAVVLLSFYLSGAVFDLYKLAIGIISLSCISSAIYTYNNLSDFKIDRYNEHKKHYAKAVGYFNKENSLMIAFIFALLGLYFGFIINFYFLFMAVALLLTGFLYSDRLTRFKEKVVLDVLFGAVLTSFFRFTASWFIFSVSLFPLLPLLALVSAKSAGYLLYKEADRQYLTNNRIKNSITVVSQKTIIFISALLWLVTFISFIFLCLNSEYFKIEYLGKLPFKFLFLIFFAVPPLIVIYLAVLNKIKLQIKYLRVIGFCYWILAIIIIWNLT